MSELIKISNGCISAQISTLGAELKSIKLGEKEILWEGDPAIWSGQAPLLFPICSGLKDDKFIFKGKEYNLTKHGYAKFSEFEIENNNSSSATFLLRSNPETLKCYPFEYELRVTYTLENNAIRVDYKVTNTGNTNMYYSIGAHEGYACPEGIENYSIVFEKTEDIMCNKIDGHLLSYEKNMIAENCKELPLKQEYFAIDAIIMTDIKSKKAAIRNLETGKIVVEVDFNGFENLLIWTKPNAPYVCIEPWCGITDYTDSDYDITKKPYIIEVLPGEESLRCHSITLFE